MLLKNYVNAHHMSEFISVVHVVYYDIITISYHHVVHWLQLHSKALFLLVTEIFILSKKSRSERLLHREEKREK